MPIISLLSLEKMIRFYRDNTASKAVVILSSTRSKTWSTSISCFTLLSFLTGLFPPVGQQLFAQSSLPTVPTAIYVGNAAFQAPIYGAKVALTLLETFDNKKRPVRTFVGEFVSDSMGSITVSLIPDKSYMVTTSKMGYFSQLSKIKTTNFSRTRQNKKGISLRPRNVIAIKGNIAKPKDAKGMVTLTNKSTNFERVQLLDETGNYELKAVKGDAYEMHVFIEGLIDTVVGLDADQLAASSANVPFVYDLVPDAPKPNFLVGDILNLPALNLLFIDRSTRLSSEIWLDTLKAVLAANPTTIIEIQVHTDARKSDRLNYILSKKRVEVLEKELMERRISEQQYLLTKKGEDEILNQCVDGVACSKADHAVNNRVVLIVNKGPFLYKP
jgi:hypothetical protein